MARDHGSSRIYPPSERDIEKAQQRLRDKARLRSGSVSTEDLRREDPFAGIAIERFEIVSIGRRPVSRRRRNDDAEPR